jgi:aspartate kinase
MIVAKFGGTSVQDGAAMRRAVDIVASQKERCPLVVLSAIGGATNSFVSLGRTALTGDTRAAQEILADLISRHRWILFDLDLEPESEREVADIISRCGEELNDFIRGVVLLRELTPRIQDAIAGYGERLSTLLFSARAKRMGLDSQLVDARDIVVTDHNYTKARPNRSVLDRRASRELLPLIESGRVPITQGFIGSTEDGIPTTLGRGGSDYTASLLGSALNAEEVQIWTDVDGMLTADSRIVAECMKVREISFEEAAELAYFGAKVLHPSTIEPAVSSSIPVRILNSRRPRASGTKITVSPNRTEFPVKSIAVKKGITIVHVRSLRMLMAHGFLRSMFEVFDRHEVSVDLVSTSEVSVSLTVEQTDRLESVVEELSRFSRVQVETSCAIVCIVGEGLRSTPGVAARTFRSLEDINVLMISQGASEINLSFVVREGEAEDTVRRLHAEFFSGMDWPDVFEPLDLEAIS